MGSRLQDLVTLARHSAPVARLGLQRLRGRPLPFQITLSLTNRCNFSCVYCEIPHQRRAELTTAEWCSAIDELRDAGMGRASIMGGEPLLRDDVGAIVNKLKSRGVHASLNTNGWLVEERLGELVALDLVCITLDPRPVHDTQRRAGSHERAVRAIELLRGRGVKVVTMTVVTAAGADHLDDVLDVARAHGIQAFFQLEHDRTMDVAAPLAPGLDDARIRRLAADLEAKKRAGAPVGNSLRVLEEQQRRGRYLGSCDECYAGRYYAYVMSDGTLAPCLLTQAAVPRGNGRALGMARAFEELAPPEGPGCACVPSHEVNALLSLDPRVMWSALSLALG